MEPSAPPPGFVPADFSAGFLDFSGPYHLRDDGTAATVLGLRVQERHGNYLGVAHGGLLATFADVALSYQVHASETPRLKVATNALTTNFIAGVKAGDWLEATCRIDRLGKRLAYTSGEIRRGEEVVMTMSAVFTIFRQT
jgi:acyl-coenzyme A thioesterase 13